MRKAKGCSWDASCRPAAVKGGDETVNVSTAYHKTPRLIISNLISGTYSALQDF